MQKAGASLTRLAVRRTVARWQQTGPIAGSRRGFHGSGRMAAVKPFILADIGEGIKEVQIIQWFVQPGARVEQFDKICEVQSDKASVDITSRFDGVIKKLHYDPDDMAQVGKPLCDIDIQGNIDPADEKLLTPDTEQTSSPSKETPPHTSQEQSRPKESSTSQSAEPQSKARPSTKSAAHLATPAVRGLLKELKVDIEEVEGTGRDGRVLKEDVHKFVSTREKGTGSPQQTTKPTIDDGPQRESKVALSPMQNAMFKSMTKSLSIPHFLFADEVNLSSLSSLRKTLNELPGSPTKLSNLSFIIKAVSVALHDFPLLNSRVEVSGNGSSPQLIRREKHNIGVAMDTPSGLMVPNIKNVASLSVYEIAEQLLHLQSLAKAGKLSNTELKGGTITVSNIGSIGGTYATPLIVESEVAILATGKARIVPAFDENGGLVKKTVGNFSWSADHRVIDGATMARMGERVRQLIEEPGLMAAGLR